MRVRPVRRAAAPRYPTRDYLCDHPELLELVPERWRHNSLVLAVLGGVVSLILACQAAGQQAVDAPGTTVDELPIASRPVIDGVQVPMPGLMGLDSMRLVSLGTVWSNSQGAFGCMAMNPPMFLTEADARQVVADEVKRAAWRPTSGALTVHAVPDADVGIYPSCWYLDNRKQNSSQGSEAQAGAGSRRQGELGCISSHIPGTEASMGIFYEPGSKIKNSKADSKAVARLDNSPESEQLRRQVRDFIQWLKAQGVI